MKYKVREPKPAMKSRRNWFVAVKGPESLSYLIMKNVHDTVQYTWEIDITKAPRFKSGVEAHRYFDKFLDHMKHHDFSPKVIDSYKKSARIFCMWENVPIKNIGVKPKRK